METGIQVTEIKGERLWEAGDKMPHGKVGISHNVNITGVKRLSGTKVEVKYMANVSYVPSVAQITIKGVVFVEGKPHEMKELIEAKKKKKPPPAQILEVITRSSIVHAVLISGILNVYPPIPFPALGRMEAKKPADIYR